MICLNVATVKWTYCDLHPMIRLNYASRICTNNQKLFSARWHSNHLGSRNKKKGGAIASNFWRISKAARATTYNSRQMGTAAHKQHPRLDKPWRDGGWKIDQRLKGPPFMLITRPSPGDQFISTLHSTKKTPINRRVLNDLRAIPAVMASFAAKVAHDWLQLEQLQSISDELVGNSKRRGMGSTWSNPIGSPTHQQCQRSVDQNK